MSHHQHLVEVLVFKVLENVYSLVFRIVAYVQLANNGPADNWSFTRQIYLFHFWGGSVHLGHVVVLWNCTQLYRNS